MYNKPNGLELDVSEVLVEIRVGLELDVSEVLVEIRVRCE